MKSKTLVSDFTQGSIPKQLVAFATPLFLSSLLQIVYNTVDMVIVGQKLGKAGLSAVAVGGDITNFMTFFGMGFANAGQVIISQYIGSKQQDKLSRFIGTMFTSLISCALLISIICLIFRYNFLNLMNTPVESYSGALGIFYRMYYRSGIYLRIQYDKCCTTRSGGFQAPVYIYLHSFHNERCT